MIKVVGILIILIIAKVYGKLRKKKMNIFYNFHFIGWNCTSTTPDYLRFQIYPLTSNVLAGIAAPGDKCGFSISMSNSFVVIGCPFQYIQPFTAKPQGNLNKINYCVLLI